MVEKEVRPARGKIFVKVEKIPRYRKGSLEMPETVSSIIPPQQGEVIAVGAGIDDIAVGEQILFGRGMQTEFSTFSVIPRDAVVCKIEREAHASV